MTSPLEFEGQLEPPHYFFFTGCSGVNGSISRLRFFRLQFNSNRNSSNSEEMWGFCSNVLNGIPVVGHVKSGIHVLAGDGDEARKAWNGANRSSAVMIGGAVGMTGGPAGAVAGAMAAGAIVDSAQSVANGRPVGIVKGFRGIMDDVKNGKVPVGSVCSTTLIATGDALGGVGGAQVAGFAEMAAPIARATGRSLIPAAIRVGAPMAAGASAARSAGNAWGKNNLNYD